MSSSHHIRFINLFLVITLCALLCSVCVAQTPLENASFDQWRNEFKQKAMDAGISHEIIAATLEHVTLLPQVVKLDRAQPEFVTPYWDYYNKRIDQAKIKQGKALLQKHDALLTSLEKKYGVPKAVLVAFWGLETHYGQFKGNTDIFSTLATLAFEGRRAAFFSQQLLDAMRIAEKQHIKIGALKGSWAGAFGHLQFMPSTFQAYAIDGNGDGVIDLNYTLEDAFASAAHYLSSIGWDKTLPIALEVELPRHFLWQTAQLGNRKTIAAWQVLGLNPSEELRALVTQAPDLKSSIVLPQGIDGPAYMVFDNFDLVMQWNRSIFYALTVAALSQHIQGDGPLMNAAIKHQDPKMSAKLASSAHQALSFKGMQSLQSLLNAHGFNAGVADGFPGAQTQAAIRAYQLTKQLPADGYASHALLERLMLEPM